MLVDREDIFNWPNSSAHRGTLICNMRAGELLILVGLCVLFCAASSLKICAFNVQSFGESKANNQKVMSILLKVYLCVHRNSKVTTVKTD